MASRPPRRGTLRARVELCLAAFAPAFGVMAWRSWGTVIGWGGLLIAGLGLVVFFEVLRATWTGNPESREFTSITDSSAEVLGHVGAYLALAVIDPASSRSDAVLACVILGLIFLIHASAGLVHANPLFYLVGYRTFSATTSTGRSLYLIARSDVADWSGPRPVVHLAGSGSIVIERPLDGTE